MGIVQEVWDWIERQETDFVNKGIPFSDRQVNYLILQLRLIEPYLQKYCEDKELTLKFADKMEIKFYKMSYHKRFLLFDFVKNFIHDNLIKKGIL